MTQDTVHARQSPIAIRAAIGRLPAVAVAGGPAIDLALLRAGRAILGHIRRAFIIKSRGGTDEAGETWAPLSPRTVAYTRTRGRGGKKGRTRTERDRSDRPSQALSKKQQERWWEVYRKYLAINRGNKGRAAAVAWLILKGEGATTLVQKYGSRQTNILQDTGALLASLSPNSGSPDQVLRVEDGRVVVGTTRAGAADHHEGIPGRLPQRRLWPSPANWPQAWWDSIMTEVKRGLLEITTSLIKAATR